MAVYLSWDTAIPVGAVLLSFYILLYFLLKGRKTKALIAYLVFQGMLFIGAVNLILLDVLFYSGIYNPWAVWLVDYGVAWTGQSFLGLAWLVFCIYYIQNHLGGYKRIIYYLTGQIAIVLAVLLVDSTRVLIPNASGAHLLYNQFWTASLYYCQFFTSAGCMVFGTVLLIKQTISRLGKLRRPLNLVVGAALLNAVLEIIQMFLFGMFKIPSDWPEINLHAIGYFVTALLLAIAILKYRFLDVVPVALRNIVDSMTEAMMVVDLANRMIDTNRAFQNRFGDYLGADRGDLGEFMTRLQPNLIKNAETAAIVSAIQEGVSKSYNGELGLQDFSEERSGPSYFVVHIEPLLLNARDCLGRVITFHDITDYRALVGELATAQERNRLARDVHDTMGHTMVTLITQLKVLGVTCETSPGKTRDKINEALVVAKNGLQELRRSLAGLDPEPLERKNLSGVLFNLAQNFRDAGVEVNLIIEGQRFLPAGHIPVIYRICQEALTNSQRHGKAQKVEIVIRSGEDVTKVFIVDNGIGCQELNKGYGIRGMEQRVHELHGNLRCGCGGEGGFSIFAEIPHPTTKPALEGGDCDDPRADCGRSDNYPRRNPVSD